MHSNQENLQVPKPGRVASAPSGGAIRPDAPWAADTLSTVGPCSYRYRHRRVHAHVAWMSSEPSPGLWPIPGSGDRRRASPRGFWSGLTMREWIEPELEGGSQSVMEKRDDEETRGSGSMRVLWRAGAPLPFPPQPPRGILGHQMEVADWQGAQLSGWPFLRSQ